MHRLVYVRHAYGLLEAGFKLLNVLIFVVFGLWVLNRNLSWTYTYAQLLKGSLHRMPQGIFCMAENLTEVIGNIRADQTTKEFYVVTSYKGKITAFANAFIYNFVAISCFLLSLKSRSEKKLLYL